MWKKLGSSAPPANTLESLAEKGDAKAAPELADVYFVLGQRYEKGEGVAQNQQAASQFYAQAAALGNKRAVDHLAEIREQREMQIRSAGTRQAASATMAADAFEVIFWIPPQPSRGGKP